MARCAATRCSKVRPAGPAKEKPANPTARTTATVGRTPMVHHLGGLPYSQCCPLGSQAGRSRATIRLAAAAPGAAAVESSMKISVLGGGPGGLYFSILMKKAFPSAELSVIERNGPQDTFGWGVVFSEETLGNLAEADPESYAPIEASFVRWDDIATHFRGECVVSTGHGFCGLSRRRLLNVLQQRCEELGVPIAFHRDLKGVDEIPPADLIVAADGANSLVRGAGADVFRPRVDWGRCRFSWLGTTRPLTAFTFHFKENEHGLFRV